MSDVNLSSSTLSAVLDELIPARDETLPGAGTLGIGDIVEARLGPQGPAIAEALRALDRIAEERSANDFSALQSEDRLPLLEEVAATHAGFLDTLIFHSYAGYYEHPRVLVAMGLEARPPHPMGYEVEAGDLDRLDRVRKRRRMYRPV